MKKIMDKKYLIFIGSIFIIGLIFGICFIFFIDSADKLMVKNELVSYIESIKSSDIKLLSGFYNSIKINSLYLFIMAISSLLFIFSFMIPFVVFYKGASVGFLISCFIYSFKSKGILYSFVFMLPHEFINIITIIFFSYYSLKYSYKLFIIFKNKEELNIRKFCNNYFIIFFCFIFVELISSILEIFLNYKLITFFI